MAMAASGKSQAVAVPKGRQNRPYEVYSQLYFAKDNLGEVVRQELLGETDLKRKTLPAINKAAKQAYETADDEKRAAVQAEIQRRKDAEKASKEGKTTPEAYNEAIRVLPSIASKFLKEQSIKTGWCFRLLAGGPHPSLNGELDSFALDVGKDKNGHRFNQARNVVSQQEVFLGWLGDTFPKDIRQSRALLTQPGAEATQPEQRAPSPAEDEEDGIVPKPANALEFAKLYHFDDEDEDDLEHPSQNDGTSTGNMETSLTGAAFVPGASPPASTNTPPPIPPSAPSPAAPASTNSLPLPLPPPAPSPAAPSPTAPSPAAPPAAPSPAAPPAAPSPAAPPAAPSPAAPTAAPSPATPSSASPAPLPERARSVESGTSGSGLLPSSKSTEPTPATQDATEPPQAPPTLPQTMLPLGVVPTPARIASQSPENVRSPVSTPTTLNASQPSLASEPQVPLNAPQPPDPTSNLDNAPPENQTSRRVRKPAKTRDLTTVAGEVIESGRKRKGRSGTTNGPSKKKKT
ncbi:hypothetical protein BDN72DRAFT_906277 [Pluteus cervinus]|uniref:Uncharacterized protein n=1 Tax=Pluteus cervinus TaxID=181527 RepID=A0ACD3A065_9AGAR|nr:hypothetical protein BDN72DRAFT_906277 [Pluteus cervinus]